MMLLRWKISRQYFVGVSAARGEGHLFQGFPYDKRKTDIWCRLVPFIWAWVGGVCGGGAQVPLRWSQAQYYAWLSSLISRDSPHTIWITLFRGEDFHNIPTKCLWRGWWPVGVWVVGLFLAKGTTSRTLVLLISDKKEELSYKQRWPFWEKRELKGTMAKFDK